MELVDIAIWAGLILAWVPSLYMAQRLEQITDKGLRIAVWAGVIGCFTLTIALLARDRETLPFWFGALVVVLLIVAGLWTLRGLTEKLPNNESGKSEPRR